jgi:cobalt-zinc-cadmium efflux system outer membrane protein
MNKNLRILFFIYLFINQFLIPPIRAEEVGEALSLKEALSMAYDHNPQMIVARKSIDAAKGDLITTKTLSNPELEFEIGGLKKNEEGERRTNLGNVSIKQEFDPPGVYWLKNKIARNDVKIGEESLKSVWSSVYSDVREAYIKIILDKKELELADSNLKALRQFFSNVQIRFQSGQAIKNDLQRARIELLKTENEYLVAEKNLKTDKAKLNLFLGRVWDVAFDIKEELKEENLKLDFKQLTDVAFSRRPDIKIEKFEMDSKNKKLKKEELSRLPSFALGFQKTNEDYEKDYSAVIEVSVPFWNLNQGEVKKAKAEQAAQKVKLETVEREVVFDLYQAYLNADLSQKQLDLFKQSLEEADELFRLSELGYREGHIDFINYLDQVRTAKETRFRYYEGLFNLNKTISDLEKAIYASLREEEFLK